MRMIVVFEKGLPVRHIGHLDLMRTMQRALRRTDLPIRYSNGFNPHIQLSFAAPLSVGVVGLREVMDVPMSAEVTGAYFQQAMNRVLPSCLRVVSARSVSDTFPTLMALVAGSRIRIQLSICAEATRIAEVFPAFMEAAECVTLRKTKSGENMTNIRPFIAEGSLEVTGTEAIIRCVIQNRQDGSLKPAVLMQALCKLAGITSVDYIAYREQIMTRNPQGALIGVEEYPDA